MIGVRGSVRCGRWFGWRLVADERGADLIEYGLLGGIIGIFGLLMFPDLMTRMGNTYASWGSQMNNCWVPKEPGVISAGCP